MEFCKENDVCEDRENIYCVQWTIYECISFETERAWCVSEWVEMRFFTFFFVDDDDETLHPSSSICLLEKHLFVYGTGFSDDGIIKERLF